MSTPIGAGVTRIRVFKEELNWQGRERKGMDIQYYGKFGALDSVPNICRQFAQRLRSEFAQVAVHNWFHGPAQGFEDAAGIDAKAPIGIFYGFPTTVLPQTLAGHAVKIGCFVCDPDAIPLPWVTTCNKLDLVVVPSHYCRDVFRNCGVTTPIMIVAHGVEPEYRPYSDEQRLTPFTFYNVFHPLRTRRKGTPELVRCFMRAFNGSKDYRLLLRTLNNPDLRLVLEREQAHSVVQIDKNISLPTPEFARCYSRVHCLVHPSRIEGFGMIPLQALACETPVLASHVAGLTDFLGPDNSMEIKVTGMVPARDALLDKALDGRVYTLDEDHLVAQLRAAATTWETRLAVAQQVGPTLRRTYSWDKVLTPFVTLLRDLLGAESANARRRILNAYSS